MPAVYATKRKVNYYTLDNKQAQLVLSKKQDDGKYEGTPCAALEGYLTSIKLTEWEYEGKKIPQIKLTLTDKNFEEIDSFEFNRRSLFARDLLNKLANCPSIEWIRITPWISFVDESAFTHCAIRNNDVKISNKYPKGSYPEPEILTLKSGETKSDDFDRDQFFVKLVPQIEAAMKYKTKEFTSDLKEEDFKDVDRDDIGF